LNKEQIHHSGKNAILLLEAQLVRGHVYGGAQDSPFPLILLGCHNAYGDSQPRIF
jgi:hypothetical protein